MYTHPFFEATPPGAAPGPPVNTGARVRHFRRCNKETFDGSISALYGMGSPEDLRKVRFQFSSLTSSSPIYSTVGVFTRSEVNFYRQIDPDSTKVISAGHFRRVISTSNVLARTGSMRRRAEGL